MASPQIPPPEQGQLVEVRRRPWIVKDVHPGALDTRSDSHHRVTLEALDQDAAVEELQVIWEREVHKSVFGALELPVLGPDGWDPLDRFEAFLLASRWSLASLLETLPLQAPFAAAVDPEEFQLEPVVRATAMPRVNLLIADFVGAGKTIEAGMVARELIARQRVRRILVVCPASLQVQWAEEMLEKFSLPFQIVDRDYVLRMQREYGIHVNPWTSAPRLITSMDYLKRSQPMAAFRASLQADGRAAALRDWDLLIVDEAHNLAPAGRRNYVRDSDRTQMIREILPHCEHRLFLTATPHNGFSESFTALLEMLDPLRFSRGPILDRAQFELHRDAVMVRRVKDEIVDDLGRHRFPERIVDPPLVVTLDEKESQLVRLLDDYTRRRLARRDSERHRRAVRFALTLLKKRLLSSPLAFRQSIQLHQTHLAEPVEEEEEERSRLFGDLARRLEEDLEDDEEKSRLEEEGMMQASTFFEATPEEIERVAEMFGLAADSAELPDTKFDVLASWIEARLRHDGDWKPERLVIFTEYRDTLLYLDRELARRGWGDRVIHLTGGMTTGQREAVKKAFRSDPREEPVRILLATDAASEGLNLQEHCRHLIHYELPWNPNKLEQRNGRIDRHGQPADKVYCLHFSFTNNEDQRFLDVIVEKVRVQRDDLGAVGDVVAREVTECLLGEREQTGQAEARVQLARQDLYGQARHLEQRRDVLRRRVRQLAQELSKAREVWRLTPDNMACVLDQALRLEGSPGLRRVTQGPLAGRAWELLTVPWAECRPYLLDPEGRRRKLVFPESVGRDDPIFRRKDVAFVHLTHPLMRRALGIFRAQLWSRSVEGQGALSRVSYKVVPPGVATRIHLVAVSRVVLHNPLGYKIHEQLLAAGGAMRGTELEWVESAEVERLLTAAGTHPPISTELGDRLRSLFPAHRRLLEAQLKELEGRESEASTEKLAQRAEEASRETRRLIEQRLRELEARLNRAAEEGEQRQLSFDFLEREQYEEDLRWLERRRVELQSELEEEPRRVRERLQPAPGAARSFPLGLLYILPEGTEGVLGRRDRGGAVTSSELYELLGGFEKYLREAISRVHPGEDWTSLLPPDRLQAARDLQTLKSQVGVPPPLLDCLHLADYNNLVLKSERLRAFLGLTDTSNTEIKRRLGRIERIRNAVMHHQDLAASAEELQKLENIRDILADLMDTFDAALAREEGM